MNRLALALAAGLLTASAAPAFTLAPAVAASPADTLTGAINAQNAGRLTGFIAGRVDKVVTLKLTIAPGTSADFKARNYMAEANGDLFIVFKQVGDDKIQVGAPMTSVRKTGRIFMLQGRFKVEYAGMGQGTMAYVLRPA